VLEADDAAGGFGMLQDNPDVQVLITDINMPGALNGWELVERAHTLRPDLKVIVASGALDPGAAFRPVVDDFVAKPFTAGALTEAIGQHVPIRSCSKAPSMTMLGIL
jgi:CheY-like chemotaxis protein